MSQETPQQNGNTGANSFLSMELGEAPPSVDYYYSLDPYLFLPSKNSS